MTADDDITGYTFDHWDGNFVQAGVIDINTSIPNPTFTMPSADINATMYRRELQKCNVIPTNCNGYTNVPPGVYSIAGNIVDTENIHYTFTGWTCVDANNVDRSSKIANTSFESTTITLSENDTLWLTANYTANYKLTVVNGQNSDPNEHYYYQGKTVNTVYANTAPSGMQFDYWDDPVGIIDDINSNIYDRTPIIIMKNSPATITAVYTSTDASGNSVVITGTELSGGMIYRRNTSLVNGIFAVGTITFDRDGCIGTITEVDPDHSDNTDDYRVQKLFYGGNF